MVKMWELLKIYSKEKVAESRAAHPAMYTKQDGPVPIRMVAESCGFTVMRPRQRQSGVLFRWSDDQHRYAILALRAVSPCFLEYLLKADCNIDARSTTTSCDIL
jgi:hypothetical protein